MTDGFETIGSHLWGSPEHQFIGWVPAEHLGANNVKGGSPPTVASWSPDHHPAFRSRTGTVVLDSKHGIDDFYHFPHDESLTPTIWRAEPHDDKTSLSIYSLADSGDTLPSKHKWWGMSSRGKSHPSVIKEMVKTIRDHRPGSTIVGERSTGWSGGTRASGRAFNSQVLSKLAAEDIERYYYEAYGQDSVP